MRDIPILPLQGRWQHEVLTEGCYPLDSATPLRLACGPTPPLQGEDDLCADTMYDR